METHGQSFSRADRLLTSHDFKTVFDDNSRRASTRNALLLAFANNGNRSRLGLVIAKKNVKLANQRNRIKRLVREYFRCHPLNVPHDLVFLARRGLGELDNDQIREQLAYLWRKVDRKGQTA